MYTITATLDQVDILVCLAHELWDDEVSSLGDVESELSENLAVLHRLRFIQNPSGLSGLALWSALVKSRRILDVRAFELLSTTK